MRIDHVILGSRTIDPLRDWLRESYGFGVTDGSPNWDGTTSWIVPMDTPLVQYLELLVVHEERALRDSAFGRLFLERTAAGPVPLNWAALVPDIAAAAASVASVTGGDGGLLEGVSVRADGVRVPWAEAGFDASWAQPHRPFFLSYGDPSSRVDRISADLRAAGHDITPTGIARLDLRIPDPADWVNWPGAEVLPVGVRAGTTGIERVVLDTTDGEVVLRWP